MANEYAIIALKSAWFHFTSMPFFFFECANSWILWTTASNICWRLIFQCSYLILCAIFDTSLNVQN